METVQFSLPHDHDHGAGGIDCHYEATAPTAPVIRFVHPLFASTYAVEVIHSSDYPMSPAVGHPRESDQGHSQIVPTNYAEYHEFDR